MSRREQHNRVPSTGRYQVPRPGENRPGNESFFSSVFASRRFPLELEALTLKFIALGSRLSGGEPTKTPSQQLFVTGNRPSGRVVDSLDLDNVLRPKYDCG